MRALISGLLCMLLVACAAPPSPPAGPAPARAPEMATTLEVENRGIDAYTIRLDGVSIGWVQPGRTACLRIPARFLLRPVQIRAEHQHGKAAFESDFSPGHHRGWTWRLGVLGSVNTFPTTRRTPCLDTGEPFGFTIWQENRPGAWGWVRIDVVFSEEGLAVIEHEAKHMEQADRMGRDLWLLTLRNRLGAAEMEAEAFCASARVALREQRFSTLESAIWHYARWLAEGYNFYPSQADAAGAIRRYCTSEGGQA